METNIKNKIDYSISSAREEDTMLLIRYKLSTIYEFAGTLEQEEKDRIDRYVKEEVPASLSKYNIVKDNGDNDVIGAFLVDDYDNGKILDEIYIEDKYRNKGIGSSIINNIINQHSVAYLWVYKMNEKAISLYKKFGFKVVEETETRYFMKYDKSNDVLG